MGVKVMGRIEDTCDSTSVKSSEESDSELEVEGCHWEGRTCFTMRGRKR